ncbi:MAG: 50S ribosomal protein L18 [Spirochaetales bacterium]|nr:50S ribosomal protein L18 [Spirochaetales bacterium]
MNEFRKKIVRRIRRKMRVRKKIKGTLDRPRMTIFKSNRFFYVQVIDDTKHATLVSGSNKEKDLAKIKTKVSDIPKLGDVIGTRLKEKKITRIIFDRNGYKYHGIVKAFADSVRKSGIEF